MTAVIAPTGITGMSLAVEIVSFVLQQPAADFANTHCMVTQGPHSIRLSRPQTISIHRAASPTSSDLTSPAPELEAGPQSRPVVAARHQLNSKPRSQRSFPRPSPDAHSGARKAETAGRDGAAGANLAA